MIAYFTLLSILTLSSQPYLVDSLPLARDMYFLPEITAKVMREKINMQRAKDRNPRVNNNSQITSRDLEALAHNDMQMQMEIVKWIDDHKSGFAGTISGAAAAYFTKTWGAGIIGYIVADGTKTLVKAIWESLEKSKEKQTIHEINQQMKNMIERMESFEKKQRYQAHNNLPISTLQQYIEKDMETRETRIEDAKDEQSRKENQGDDNIHHPESNPRGKSSGSVGGSSGSGGYTRVDNIGH